MVFKQICIQEIAFRPN